MDIIHIIILAIIEGITEFLPVSSTGHLIVAQKIFGLEKIDEFTTVILQFAAILAAIFFFRKRIIEILRNTIKNIQKKQIKKDMGIWVIISIIPTLGIAFVLKNHINTLQNSSLVIGISTIIFGIIFYGIEKIFLPRKNKLSLETTTCKHIFIVGLFQILSLIPGTSRSGSTISGGLTQNISFKDSIEIAFLMGIPVMFIASIYEIYKALPNFSSSMLLQITIGSVISFTTALISIKFTVGLLEKKGFLPFTLYRIAFGIIILLFVR